MQRREGLIVGVAVGVLASGGAFGQLGIDQPRIDEKRRILLEQAQKEDVAVGGPPFGWTAADGSSFFLGGQLQFRYTGNRRDGDVDSYVGGFQHRRTRLKLKGTLPEGRVTYAAVTQFNAAGGLGMLDAWTKIDLGEGYKLRVGRFLLPFDREFQVPNLNRTVTELTSVGQIVGASIGTGRSEGVEFGYDGDEWRWSVAFTDGVGSAANSFSAGTIGAAADWAVTGRVTRLAFGDYASFTDEQAFSGTEGGLVFGAAAHVEGRQLDADLDGGFDDRRLDFRWTTDVAYERPYDAAGPLAGLSVQAGVFGRHQDTENFADRERYGIVGQAGYMLDEDTQVFTRYEWATIENTSSDLSQIAVGINEFFDGNNVRFTADVVYNLETVGFGYAIPGRGVLVDGPDERGQAAIRAQIQLGF